MANEKETEQAEVVLGPMQLSDAAAFKAAIKKAKEHPVDCGIFSYVSQLKKEKKENK